MERSPGSYPDRNKLIGKKDFLGKNSCSEIEQVAHAREQKKRCQYYKHANCLLDHQHAVEMALDWKTLTFNYMHLYKIIDPIKKSGEAR